jgi:hypothetical protein
VKSLTIQGYILLHLTDNCRGAYTEVFNQYSLKFNLGIIGGCVGERHSLRRTFWDYIPAGVYGYTEDTVKKWSCVSFYELEEMVRSGRVELTNHTMTHTALANLYDSVLTRDTSLLTGTASSGQKVVAVADGTKFDAKDRVKIYDDSHFEWNKIASINGNNLTMVNNLQYTYTVAANGAVLETGLSEMDLKREIEPVDDLIKLVGQSEGCSLFSTPFGSFTAEEIVLIEEMFAHYFCDVRLVSDYLNARNTFPLSKELKGWMITDKWITDHAWTDVDNALNDARNNHVLHLTTLEGVDTENVPNGDHHLSPINFATLASKLADFQAAGHLILASELGTLI